MLISQSETSRFWKFSVCEWKMPPPACSLILAALFFLVASDSDGVVEAPSWSLVAGERHRFVRLGSGFVSPASARSGEDLVTGFFVWGVSLHPEELKFHILNHGLERVHCQVGRPLVKAPGLKLAARLDSALEADKSWRISMRGDEGIVDTQVRGVIICKIGVNEAEKGMGELELTDKLAEDLPEHGGTIIARLIFE